MHLQNRVTPFGDQTSHSARGMFMGNRGILHNKQGDLTAKRWANKSWVTCALSFKDYRRKPKERKPNEYTELFFHDEATALAAGHRPCGQCRYKDFVRFVEYWARGNGKPEEISIKVVDAKLHGERVTRSREKVTYSALLDTLPDGVFVELNDEPATAWLIWHDRLHRWQSDGYGEQRMKPLGTKVAVLTPESTVNAIVAGYHPQVKLLTPQIHPESAQLAEEVRLLRDQLARLLQEREDLVSTVIPNLEAHYYVIIGKHQYDLFCIECEVRRIKRKIEMIQVSLNRMERVDMDLIEKTLDGEQTAWKKLIDDMARKLELAKLWTSAERLSDDEQKELKKLYYELAKKAHPDIHQDQSERLNSIWLQIVSAYQSGSLEGMKALALLLEDDSGNAEPPAADVLEDQHTRLKDQLDQLAQVLSSLQQSFPCTIKDQINDQNWIDARVAEILEKQTMQSQQKEQLLIILAGMISGLAHDKQSHNH